MGLAWYRAAKALLLLGVLLLVGWIFMPRIVVQGRRGFPEF
jgi:hypothetical protein